MSIKEVFTLKNGIIVPCPAFGTFQIEPGDTTKKAVLDALEAGYRHIDTAFDYKNEADVGAAIRESGLKREDVFVTSKLFTTETTYEDALNAFKHSLERMGIEHLDMYLIHFPYRKHPMAKEINAARWKALETAYREGLVRAIGVCNYATAQELDELYAAAEIKPMVNQIEMHVCCLQKEVLDWCEKHDVVVEAWSPLGHGKLLSAPYVADLAAKYHCAPSQLLLRWCVQHNAIPLPKTVNPERMKTNLDLYQFTISDEDMAFLDSLPEDKALNMDDLPL